MSSEPSKATRAVEYAVQLGAEFWHDPDNEPYADVPEGPGIRQTIPIRSREFRTWLSGVFYEFETTALGRQSATDAVDLLAAKAVHGGLERPVYVRAAGGDDEAIYIDLGDPTWKAVKVSREGWEVVSHPPVRFRRPSALRSLPVPSRDGNLEKLRQILPPIEERDWILTVAWILGSLHPDGPYPILCLMGEHGTAKTSTARVIRSLVDPSKAPLRSPPRDDRDLIVAARNSHIIGLDNLSRIQEWLSDALCRISTGGGYSARELYTNGEEVVYADRRPIILTSIESVVIRGDLADRSIPITLPVLPESSRRTQADLNAELEKIRPGVLGALLDAISMGLRSQSDVELERLPRMADFATWIVACEPALPWEQSQFLEAYTEARRGMIESGIEADSVASAVVRFMNERSVWKGTATALLEAMNAARDQAKNAPGDWPDSPRVLSEKLKRAAPLLRESGIQLERGKEGGERFIRLTKEEAADRDLPVPEQTRAAAGSATPVEENGTVGTQQDGLDGVSPTGANGPSQGDIAKEAPWGGSLPVVEGRNGMRGVEI